MSQEIDNQIVKMEFDNKNFERNTKQSLSTIERLKRALNFDEEARSIKELEKAANHLTLDDLGASLENLKKGFEGWGLVGKKIIWDLTGEFEKLGAKMISAMNAPFAQIKSGGWARAMKIKDAKFSIEGLGKDFTKYEQDINDAVSGTAYGYDSAAKAAAQFAASGIQVGKATGQMGQALRSISGVAAQTNSSYDEIANIFTTIAANGKLMTLQLRQLSFRGMNAAAVLAKHLGTTEAAVNDLVQKGEVDFATFAEAMDEAFGEHATKANETFQGALDNMKAALSRVGANYASPLIDAERDVFNATRVIINSVNDATKEFDKFYGVMKTNEKLRTASDSFLLSEYSKNVLKDLKYSFSDLTAEYAAEYDELSKLTKKTDEQKARMKELAKEIKKGISIGKEYRSKWGGDVTWLLDEYAKHGTKFQASNKLIFDKIKKNVRDTGFFMTSAGQEAAKEYNRIKEEVKSAGKETEAQTKRLEYLEKVMRGSIVSNAGASIRLVETYKQALEAARRKIVGILEDGELYTALNNFIDGVNAGFQQILKFVEPVIKAWRTVFSEKETHILAELTQKFKDFMQSLRLSKEYGEDVYEVFSAVFTVFDILKTIVGDVFRVIGTVGSAAFKVLMQFAKPLSDIIFEVDYRFRQLRAGVLFVVEYFGQLAEETKFVSNVFNRLAKVVGVIGKILGVVASVLGGVLLTAIVIIGTALSKLAGIVKNIFTFIQPVLSSLIKFFSSIGKAISSAFNSIIKPFQTYEKSANGVVKGTAKIGSKTVPVLKTFAAVIQNVAVAVRDFVANGIGKLADAVGNFSFGDFVTGIRDKFVEIANSLKSGATSIPELIGQGIGSVFLGLINIIGKAGKAVADFFSQLFTGKKIFSSFTDEAKKNDGLLGRIKSFFSDMAKSDAMKKIGDGLSTITEKIKEFAKEITPARVYAILFIGAFVLMTKAVYDLMKAVTNFVTYSAGIPSSISGMFDSLKGLFNAVKDKIAPAKKASTQFKEIAEGIVMIAGAIAVLSQMNKDGVDFSGALEVITGMMFVVLAFYALMAVISIGISHHKEAIPVFVAAVGSFIALTGSILVMALALKALTAIKIDESQFSTLAAAFGGLLALALIIGLFSRLDKGWETSPLTILAFAGSLILLTDAFKKLIGIPALAMWETFIALIPVIITLGLIGAAISRIRLTSSIGLFLVIGALAISIPLLKKLTKDVDWGLVQKTLNKFMFALAMLTVVALAVNAFMGGNLLKGFEEFGRGIASIALAFALMALVVTYIGRIDEATLIKGLSALSWLTLLVMGMEAVAGKTAGNEMRKFATGLLVITMSFAMMTALITIIGSIDLPTLAQGLVALFFLTSYVAMLMSVSENLKGVDSKSMGLMISLTVSIVALSVALAVLSERPWDKILGAAGAMGLVMLTFAATIVATSKLAAKGKKAVGAIAMLLVLTGSIVVLGWGLTKLSEIPWNKILPAAISMGIVMLSFAKSLAIIEKSLKRFKFKTMFSNLVLIATMALAINVIGLTLSEVARRNWDSLLAGGIAMGICISAFGDAFAMIADSLRQFNIKTMLPNLALIGAIAGAILVLGGSLALIATQPWERILASGIAMKICIDAFTEAFKTIAGSLKQFQMKTMLPNLALMGVMAGAILVIGGMLALVANQPWEGILAGAVAMSACMLAYAQSIKMLQGINIDPSVLGAMLISLAPIITIGILLMAIAKLPWDGLLAAGVSMSLCLLAVGGMIKIINGIKVDPSSLLGLIVAIGTIAAVGVALFNLATLPWQGLLSAGVAIAACLLAVGGMIRFISGVKVDVSSLLSFVAAAGLIYVIGLSLKNISGDVPWENIVAALGMTAVCILAVGFMLRIISGIKIDLSAGLTLIVAIGLIAAIGVALSIVSKSPWESILAAGTAILEVLVGLTIIIGVLGSIPAVAGVKAALNVIGFIAVVAVLLLALDKLFSLFGGKGLDTIADLFEKLGEIIGKFISGIGKGMTSEMPAMGENLSAFAESSKTFFDLMSKIDGNSIKATMEGISSGIATIVSLRFNNVKAEDYVSFGEAVTALGKGVKQFYLETINVDPETVKTKSEALVNLMTALSKLPRNGGLFGGIFGDRESYDTFKEGLEKLGPALVQFQKDTEGLKTETIEQAATAVGIVTEFMKDMPRNGGLFGGIFGDRESYDTFKEGLEKLGPALKQFATDTDGLKTSAIEQASTAMKMLTEIAKEIPNTGGAAGFWAGNNDLDTFSEMLPTVGKNLSEFASNLSTTSSTTVRTFSASIKDLVDSSALVADKAYNKNALKEFSGTLPSAAKSIGQFYENIPEDQSAKVSKFMKSMNSLKSFVSGFSNISTSNILNFTADLTQMANTGLDVANQDVVNKLKSTMAVALNDITKTYEEFKAAGANQVVKFKEGISGAFYDVNTAWKSTILDGLLTTANNYRDSFKNAGAGLTGMFAQGIADTAKVNEVRKNAKDIADKAMGAINDVVKNPYSSQDAHKAGSNLANAFAITDSELSQFTTAGVGAMDKFSSSITTNSSKAVKAFSDVITKCKDALTSSENQNKVHNAGLGLTKQFANGINDSVTVADVMQKAWNVGKAALRELDRAIKDPAGVSDEAWKYGRAFTRGFGMGIENLQKYSDQASADIGYSAVEHLDDAIEDPAGVSDKTFDLGKAFGNGFKTGIESFMSAVNNAAAQLGLSGLGGLDISLKGMKKRLKGFVSDFAGKDFADGLFGAITGVKKKTKDYKKKAKEFWKAFLPKDAKKIFEDDGKGIGDGIDKALKTGGKKGGSGGKSKYSWTAKDLTESLIHLRNIFDIIEVKADKYNKKLLKSGKVTKAYISKSFGDKYLANAFLRLDAKGAETKKVRKEARKIYKDIYDEQMKEEKKRQKAAAKKNHTTYKFDKKKAEENIMAKASEKATRKYVKSMTGEADVFYKTLHQMVGDKKLEKSLKTMPDFMASFIKNYDPSLKVLNKDIKTYAKAFGGGTDKATKKAIKAYSDLGSKLYKNSDEYKENEKQLKKNAKAIDKIREKTKKYQKIINDPKASAKRKQSAKKRIEELDKEYTAIKKSNKKIGKEMALGPGKAVKALVKDVKKAVKEYVSLSNIDFTKVLSGFDKKMESTNLQRGGFDVFNSAVISMEDATKAASDAFGILNVSVSDSINLLERFSKVSTVSARRLMKNAQSQLKGYEEYRAGLAQLREKGLSDAMIKQLESQGVSSLSQIRGFLKMSDADISKYNALVAKEEAYKAKETENSMKNQVDKYTKWVENLEKLSGKIPQKMLKELRSAGVSNADFVETLLYMDDSTLDSVTKMYTDSLQASVDAAYKTVADATENKSFKEQIAKMAEDYASWNQKIAELKTKGVSDAVIERLKSMGLADSKAYVEELMKETDEGIAYVNKMYDKSLYGGKTASTIWAEDMKATNDMYDRWDSNMKTIAKEVGKDDPVYMALKEMGFESGAEYAKAFVEASQEEKDAIKQEMARQSKANSDAILQSLNDRISTIKKWKEGLKALSEKGIDDSLMGELVEAGPESYDKVNALLEMSDDKLKTFSDKYASAIKLPDKIARSAVASYASVVTDAVNAAAKEAKSEKSKEVVGNAMKGTIKAVAVNLKPYAKAKSESVSKAGNKGLKVYLNNAKGSAIGKDTGKGLASGISSTATLVSNAAKKIARRAYLSMKKELDVNSPSKKTYEIGKFFDFGLANGISDYSRTVESSTAKMTDNLSSGLKMALYDSTSLDGMINPVIYPTLDLSDISGKVSDISAFMSMSKDIVVTLNDKANQDVVDAISAMQSDFNGRITELSDSVRSMQLVMDTGKVVGEIAGPVDAAIGKRMANRRRGM